jgi:hypothetical protein
MLVKKQIVSTKAHVFFPKAGCAAVEIHHLSYIDGRRAAGAEMGPPGQGGQEGRAKAGASAHSCAF